MNITFPMDTYWQYKILRCVQNDKGDFCFNFDNG